MQGSNIFNLLNVIKTTLNYIIPLLVSVAVIYFIWGVIEQVIAQNEEERKQSRDRIIQGIVGLFVIVAVWGIVRFVGTTLGVSVSSDPQNFTDVPQFK
jgi:uncharacterized membrane protein